MKSLLMTDFQMKKVSNMRTCPIMTRYKSGSNLEMVGNHSENDEPGDEITLDDLFSNEEGIKYADMSDNDLLGDLESFF